MTTTPAASTVSQPNTPAADVETSKATTVPTAQTNLQGESQSVQPATQTTNVTPQPQAATVSPAATTGQVLTGTNGTVKWDYDVDSGTMTLHAGTLASTARDPHRFFSGGIATWAPGNDNPQYTPSVSLFANNLSKIVIDGPVVANSISSLLFSDLSALTEIDNIQNLDTSQVTKMASMFAMTKSPAKNKLLTLDLSSWNTANVTDMSGLFQDRSAMQSVNLTNWNTSQVTTLASAFSNFGGQNGLGKATITGIENFDTSQVQSLSRTFASSSLNSLDLSHWNTGSVTAMDRTFGDMYNLTNLSLEGWNTSQVTTMAAMFISDSKLKHLDDVASFDVGQVVDMSSMFAQMYQNYGQADKGGLRNIDLSRWKVRQDQLPKTTDMFSRDSQLWEIKLGPGIVFAQDPSIPVPKNGGRMPYLDTDPDANDSTYPQIITAAESTWQAVDSGQPLAPNGSRYTPGNLAALYKTIGGPTETFVWSQNFKIPFSVTFVDDDAQGSVVESAQNQNTQVWNDSSWADWPLSIPSRYTFVPNQPNLIIDEADGTTATFKAIDHITTANNTWVIHLKHRTTTVDPGTEIDPGSPVDPGGVVSPKWPTDPTALVTSKTVQRTIHYVKAEGGQAFADEVQEVQFKRSATLDWVTGAVTFGDWIMQGDALTFPAVDSPALSGYTPDLTAVPESAPVTADTPDSEQTVTYTAVPVVTPPTDPTPTDPVLPIDPTPTDPVSPVDPTPTNPGQPNEPSDPTTPHQPNPSLPNTHTPIGPNTPGLHHTGQATVHELTSTESLPQMGDEQNTILAALGLGVTSLFSLLGLASRKRRS
ncbi:hypothetical protein FC34_GL001391 [Lacticaseibacillus brantae DSM 23927]|uniref:Gram-positive cocci surface proteins LPxTG domain-containing protein n=1 Tax=Lacticaseibacillus brantae DSM 23927 TaxID=1423727 RepID=A0A0R2B186_9LACO|nr:hypothetical protein FC34_GL001391 [Lacticaseibacillus brantae DSM 23927]